MSAALTYSTSFNGLCENKKNQLTYLYKYFIKLLNYLRPSIPYYYFTVLKHVYCSCADILIKVRH